MKVLLLSISLLAASLSFGQHYAIQDDAPRHTPQRIYLQSADVAHIVEMLSGKLNVNAWPEYSTIYAVNGFGGSGSGWGGGHSRR
jgi:hypothetical protein